MEGVGREIVILGKKKKKKRKARPYLKIKEEIWLSTWLKC
jgi:hypothetical protein